MEPMMQDNQRNQKGGEKYVDSYMAELDNWLYVIRDTLGSHIAVN
jgi:hypothetical protein